MKAKTILTSMLILATVALAHTEQLNTPSRQYKPSPDEETAVLNKLRNNDRQFNNVLVEYTKSYVRSVKHDPFHFTKLGEDLSTMPKDFWDERQYKILDICQLIIRGDEGVLSNQCEPTPLGQYKYNDILRQYGKHGLVNGKIFQLSDMQLPEGDLGKQIANYEKQLTIREPQGSYDGIYNTRFSAEFALGIGFGKRITEITYVTEYDNYTVMTGRINLWGTDSHIEMELDKNYLVRKATIQTNRLMLESTSDGLAHFGDLILAKSGTFKRVPQKPGDSEDTPKPDEDWCIQLKQVKQNLSEKQYDQLTEFQIEPLMQVNDRIRGISGTGPEYDKKVTAINTL